MEVKTDGNPGTGNHYTEIKQEIHIGSVGVYNNATTINNTYQDGRLVETKKDEAVGESEAVRKEIMVYVGKTLCLVEEKWKPIYKDLWNDILNLNEVKAEVYDPGRQQGTTFNRKLVANIIHYLGNFRGNKSGMFGAYSATPVVNELEGTTACSTRTELGSNPEKEIRDAISPLLKKYNIA